MSLKNTEVPISLTSGHEDPVNDLFIPILKNSETYKVAMGYFTSGWLRDTAEGFAEFALDGGKSYWIVSPNLNHEDAKCIANYSENHSDEYKYEKDIQEAIKGLMTETRQELCALVAAKIIIFKIAIPKGSDTGMLHAKIGIATDKEGNKIAFSGSYNLTAAAKSNWEHIDVFKSWETGESKRIVTIENRFNSLWENEDPSFETLNPSNDLIDFMTQESGPQLEQYLRIKTKENHVNEVTLRPYQNTAIESWGENKGRGCYIMATGSGKTITALATIKRLISFMVDKNKKTLVVVIVLPLKHLLDQWFSEAIEFGLHPAIKCYENSDIWRKKLAERLSALKITKQGYVITMVTNATFSTDSFQNEIGKIDGAFMFVADEAHNLGSSTYIKSLPENAQFRLGLSATPDRHNDSQGTKALFEYFGDPVINFSLSDAINNNFLCPYKYYPHLCIMTDSEYEEYIELSQLIYEQEKLSKDTGEKTKEYTRLIGKRTDLITGVKSKLIILENCLKEQKESGSVSHTLIYCGSKKGEDELRHIERTVKLVGNLGITTRKFTAEESMDDRKEILRLFASGELESIAAIKCLDEGVDVPATRIAYILASTSNPREFIQRRGRVLRKSTGKEFAVIHDFIVAPPQRRHESDDMLEKELDRALEFSELAMNSEECKATISLVADQFGIKYEQ